jgi:hypothetical protein
MMREIIVMQETEKKKNRREFIKDGLRTFVLSGLAFVGFSVGWKKASSSGNEMSCAIDLPCRICSRLPGCQKPEAKHAKQMSWDSHQNPSIQKRGPK